MGLHFYVSCAMVNEYFFENRLFAEGIAGSGMGLGTFGFSILQQYLSNNYSWKVSFELHMPAENFFVYFL